MINILNNSKLYNFIFRSANCFLNRIIYYGLRSQLCTSLLVIIDQFSVAFLNYNYGGVAAAV